jgi:hypothetical protein
VQQLLRTTENACHVVLTMDENISCNYRVSIFKLRSFLVPL